MPNKQLCSNGTACVTYTALGWPGKLSRYNPGAICYACRERRGYKRTGAAAKKSKAGGSSREADSVARLDVESVAEQRWGHVLDGWYGPTLGPGPRRIWLTRCVFCGRMGWTIRPGSEPWRLGGPVIEEPCG